MPTRAVTTHAPLDNDTIECLICAWEFRINVNDTVEDDGDVDGEAELEIDADGNTVDPDDNESFPPWHGIANANAEREGHGQATRKRGSMPIPGTRATTAQASCAAAAGLVSQLRTPLSRTPACRKSFVPIAISISVSNPSNILTCARGRIVRRGLLRPRHRVGATPTDHRLSAGHGHFRTLQETLRRAAAGQLILLRPGLYENWVSLDQGFVIIGDGPAKRSSFSLIGARSG